jgi:hypothetical protein
MQFLLMRTAICIATAAMTLSACGGGSAGATGPPAAAAAPNGPVITSEADTILHLDQLRAAGFRGGGVRVGVISTGVINLASYQAAGLLPAGIYISQGIAGALDEGSWMLELVHQHAPDAVLGFCDGVDLDFNLLTGYLLDGNSQVLTQASSQSDPTLVLDYTNATGTAQAVRLAVSLDSGSAQGLVVQVTEGSANCNIECQPLTYASSGLAGGSIGDLADALVVGATFALSPHMLEAWSNHGPFRIDFQAAADAAAPDGFDYARLAAPLQIAKPDLVAPDCVTTPFSNGKTLTNNQFCGTSAAVPSIAGAAALLESAGFDRAQVLKALRSTAVPLGAATWDPGYGFGLADAAAALHSGGN